MRGRVRALPVFPSTRGELRPLTELSLPSDFNDVLGVADVVDRDKAAGHTDLLRLLGARELDAVGYLLRHVAPTASQGITADEARAVLEIIQRHRVELDQAKGARDVLRRARLVPCADGLHPAHDVHLPNSALTLIAPEAPIADTRGMAAHLVETLVWLGVSAHPSDGVLNEAALRLGEQDEVPNTDVVLAILDALDNPPDSDTVPRLSRRSKPQAGSPAKEAPGADPQRSSRPSSDTSSSLRARSWRCTSATRDASRRSWSGLASRGHPRLPWLSRTSATALQRTADSTPRFTVPSGRRRRSTSSERCATNRACRSARVSSSSPALSSGPTPGSANGRTCWPLAIVTTRRSSSGSSSAKHRPPAR